VLHTARQHTCNRVHCAGQHCDQKEACDGAVAMRNPACNGTATDGQVCAGADDKGALFTKACVASDPTRPLVCARPPFAQEALCIAAAESTDYMQLSCDDAATGVSNAGSTQPPPAETTGGDVGVCCGSGMAWADAYGVSECCAWGVDEQGRCCHSVDACGVCNGSATSVDADGAPA
jgi:hypothetical protein